MTFEATHERITRLVDGDNRNTCYRVLGENMRDLRKTDLKLQHVSDNTAQHLKVP